MSFTRSEAIMDSFILSIKKDGEEIVNDVEYTVNPNGCELKLFHNDKVIGYFLLLPHDLTKEYDIKFRQTRG